MAELAVSTQGSTAIVGVIIVKKDITPEQHEQIINTIRPNPDLISIEIGIRYEPLIEADYEIQLLTFQGKGHSSSNVITVFEDYRNGEGYDYCDDPNMIPCANANLSGQDRCLHPDDKYDPKTLHKNPITNELICESCREPMIII